jgi:hypothetical protein
LRSGWFDARDEHGRCVQTGSLAVHLEEPIGRLVEDDVRDDVRDGADVDLHVEDETKRMVEGGDDPM